MYQYSAYLLPEGIRMPEKYRNYPCYQIWFYDGVLTAMEGYPPKDDCELRRETSNGIADAYRAGYLAGNHCLNGENSHAHGALPGSGGNAVPGSLTPWFLAGIEDAKGGQQAQSLKSLRRIHGNRAAEEYLAGFEAGKS